MNNKICITIGDYNGIGPEITIKALEMLAIPKDRVLLTGNKRIFQNFNSRHGYTKIPDYEIFEIPYDEKDYNPGKETAAAGEFSYKCLEAACTLAKNRVIGAIATAPVSKNALHLAGHDFSGQTEVLEKLLAHNKQKAEMLFTAGNFRVMLLTRHLPLSQVQITKELIFEKFVRLNGVLKEKFHIEEPSFALCALNPHAGENGILGRDEIEEFIPAISKLTDSGIKITRPMPADTLFAQAAADFRTGVQRYDCYVACYHDQGLIPIKMLAMDECVNTTIGLDVIRTSPAHGTAYDIAPYCCARAESMAAAIQEALRLCS